MTEGLGLSKIKRIIAILIKRAAFLPADSVFEAETELNVDVGVISGGAGAFEDVTSAFASTEWNPVGFGLQKKKLLSSTRFPSFFFVEENTYGSIKTN